MNKLKIKSVYKKVSNKEKSNFLLSVMKILSLLRCKTYNSNQNTWNIKVIEDIIYNEKSHLVSIFKDYLIYDDNSEFLKRFYFTKESQQRIPKIIEYYVNNTYITPNYSYLNGSKIILKGLKKKIKLDKSIKENENKNKKSKNNFNTINIRGKEEEKIFTEKLMEEIDKIKPVKSSIYIGDKSKNELKGNQLKLKTLTSSLNINNKNKKISGNNREVKLKETKKAEINQNLKNNYFETIEYNNEKEKNDKNDKNLAISDFSVILFKNIQQNNNFNTINFKENISQDKVLNTDISILNRDNSEILNESLNDIYTQLKTITSEKSKLFHGQININEDGALKIGQNKFKINSTKLNSFNVNTKKNCETLLSSKEKEKNDNSEKNNITENIQLKNKEFISNSSVKNMEENKLKSSLNELSKNYLSKNLKIDLNNFNKNIGSHHQEYKSLNINGDRKDNNQILVIKSNNKRKQPCNLDSIENNANTNLTNVSKDKGIAIFLTNEIEKNDITEETIKKESIKNYMTTVSTDKLNINLNINFNTTNYSSLSKNKAISEKSLLNKNHFNDKSKEIGIIKNCISNITNLFDNNNNKKNSIVKKFSSKNSFNMNNVNNHHKLTEVSKDKNINKNKLSKNIMRNNEINNNSKYNNFNFNTIEAEHIITDSNRIKKTEFDMSSKINKTKIEVTKLPLTITSLNTKYSDLNSEPNSYHHTNYNDKVSSYQNSNGKIIFNNQISLNNFNNIKSNMIQILKKDKKENEDDNISVNSKTNSQNGNKLSKDITNKYNNNEKQIRLKEVKVKALETKTSKNIMNLNLKIQGNQNHGISNIHNKIDEKVFLKTKSEIIDKKMPIIYNYNNTNSTIRENKVTKNVEASLLNTKLNKSINNLGLSTKIFKIKGNNDNISSNNNNCNNTNFERKNKEDFNDKKLNKNKQITNLIEQEVETKHPGLKISEILNSNPKKNEDSYINIDGYCLTDTNFISNIKSKHKDKYPCNNTNKNNLDEENIIDYNNNYSNLDNEYYLKTITNDNNFETIINSKNTIDATVNIKNKNSSIFEGSNKKKVFNAKFNTINNKIGTNNLKISSNVKMKNSYNMNKLKCSKDIMENKNKNDNKATINSTISKKSKNSKKEIAIANIIKNTVDSYYMLKSSGKTKIKNKENKNDKMEKINKQLNIIDLKNSKLVSKKL